MAISGFAAEKADSQDQLFAVLKTTSDSFLYPVGFTAWGSSASINVTSTSAPFPVTLVSGNSGIEVTVAALTSASKIQVEPVTSSARRTFVDNNSAHPVFTTTKLDSTHGGFDASASALRVTVVSGADGNDTTVTVTALTSASKIQIEPVTTSANRTFVDNNSAHPVFTTAKLDSTHGGYDASASAMRVSIVSGADGNDTTVTASITGTAAVEPTSSATIALRSTPVANGIQTTQLALSSLAQTVMTASGTVYGWSMSNGSSDTDIWVKAFSDDSAGVTLGTTAPKWNILIPFGGGREAFWPVGVPVSSGLSIAAAATAPSTAHDAPAATGHITVYFDPSS